MWDTLQSNSYNLYQCTWVAKNRIKLTSWFLFGYRIFQQILCSFWLIQYSTEYKTAQKIQAESLELPDSQPRTAEKNLNGVHLLMKFCDL